MVTAASAVLLLGCGKSDEPFHGPISLNLLIADEEGAHAGWVVVVHGFLSEKNASGGFHLYPSREISVTGTWADGLYIEPFQWAAVESCAERYVSITGLLGVDGDGLFGLTRVDSVAEIDEKDGQMLPCVSGAEHSTEVDE